MLNFYICFFVSVEVRLSHSFLSSKKEGFVDVKYNGRWGIICADKWNWKNARVVCRMAGQLPPTKFYTIGSYGGRWRAKTWMSGVDCRGDEKSLADCPHRGWGNAPGWCNYKTAAAVRCGGKGQW